MLRHFSSIGFVAAAVLAGCSPSGPDDGLVVLTTWDRAEREAVATRARAAGSPMAGATRWVRVAASEIRQWLAAGRRADLILGAPAWVLEDLARSGLLRPPDDPEGRAWIPTGERPVGLVGLDSRPGPTDWSDLVDHPEVGLHLADPRVDPATRAWAEGRLAALGWREGYAELVRVAASARSAGWPAVGDRPLLRAASTPSEGSTLPEPSITLREGAAVPRTSLQPDDALRFLQTIAPRIPEEPGGADPLLGALRADLLGATLIEAQADLRVAARRIEEAGRPVAWLDRLTTPPPWPPASILRLRDDPARADDLDALAEALAPALGARAWLRASWDRPRRPIDEALLREIAEVEGGELASSPSFRAWLRGEWSAWAGQWYRWIGRRAHDPPPEGPP